MTKTVADNNSEEIPKYYIDKYSLGVAAFKKVTEYHRIDLKNAKEVADKSEEGGAYGNLGNAY